MNIIAKFIKINLKKYQFFFQPNFFSFFSYATYEGDTINLFYYANKSFYPAQLPEGYFGSTNIFTTYEENMLENKS